MAEGRQSCRGALGAILKRYAISSVVSQYCSALPEGPARDGREIELQLARGLSLFTAKGFSAVEAA